MSTITKTVRFAQLVLAADKYGISLPDLRVLLRAERTLHRWYEQECGDSNAYNSWAIERDETTGIPYRCVYPHNSNNVRREKIPDREAGAIRRVEEILQRYPELQAVYQTDPRGCALYLVRKSDVAGLDQAQWSSHGLAICAE